MKLFNLRLTTLKSKLYAIVFASFILRVIAVLTLPDSPSNLGPDEGTYAGLTEVLVSSVKTGQYPYSSFGIVSSPLVLPASLLHILGVSTLTSVRIISSTYGLSSLILVALMANSVLRKIESSEGFAHVKSTLLISLVAIYAFFPSHFLWSILGLRESSLEFWLLIFFTSIFRLTYFKKRHSPFYWLLLIAILNICIIRQQLVWIIIFIAAASSLKISRSAKSMAFVALIVITGFVGKGIVSGNMFGSQISYETTKVVENQNSNVPLNSYCQKINEIIETKSGLAKCKLILSFDDVLTGGTNPIKDVNTISEAQRGNQDKAASVIKPFECEIYSTAVIGAVLCPIFRYLYLTNTFLFRPYLGDDITSHLSLYGAVENIFWLSVFLYIFVLFIRNRKLAFFGALAPPLFFLSVYSVAAGSYEGNMGTAFRHKSLILWVVILLLASTIVATQQRKAEREGISG